MTMDSSSLPLSDGAFVFPGDVVSNISDEMNLILGTGIARSGEVIVATKAGKLRVQNRSNRKLIKYWVDNRQVDKETMFSLSLSLVYLYFM